MDSKVKLVGKAHADIWTLDFLKGIGTYFG